MNFVRRVATALGGIFFAALLVAALAPKATRGVAAALVQVTNTSANPVPVIAADSPANFPFAALLCENNPKQPCIGDGEFIVPTITSGLPVKRLVIENVSGTCELTPGVVNFVLSLDVEPVAGSGGPFVFPFPLVPASPSNSPRGFVVSGSAVRIYVDPGDTVIFGVNAGLPNGDSESCNVVVQGHLETK